MQRRSKTYLVRNRLQPLSPWISSSKPPCTHKRHTWVIADHNIIETLFYRSVHLLICLLLYCIVCHILWRRFIFILLSIVVVDLNKIGSVKYSKLVIYYYLLYLIKIHKITNTRNGDIWYIHIWFDTHHDKTGRRDIAIRIRNCLCFFLQELLLIKTILRL